MAHGADGDGEELAAYLALTQVPGIGAGRLRRLLERFTTARGVLTAPRRALAAVPGIGPAGAATIAAVAPAHGVRILAAVERLGARVLLPWNPDFPVLLREIPEPPAVLFAWGDVALLGAPAAALVGSRVHTAYGATAASLLASGLAAAGVIVVSGMARGIDAVAHVAALDAGGASVGVLGNGFGVIYPAAHRALYERMVSAGCLVTELPPGERPRVHTFPRRNRLIAGLARATVVVEARAGSGALITADCALEQGRSVLAVPGPITSPTALGGNRLIQQGAQPCLAVSDILEELKIPLPAGTVGGHGGPTGRRPPADLSAVQRSLWEALATAPAHVDVLGETVGARTAELLGALTELELRGLVTQRAGMWFELR